MLVHKSWLFATSFPPLIRLAATCPHDGAEHLKVAGARDASGGFLSQQTAIYPEALATSFAEVVGVRLSPACRENP